MDLRRLRFGDWVMAGGGLAVLLAMLLDWYRAAEPAPTPVSGGEILVFEGELNAWQAFSAVDVILAAAAVLALVAFVATATQPTGAVPLALGVFTALLALVALVLVAMRLIWPPDIGTGEEVATVRLAGAWIGLVTTTVLAGGAFASIRDERLPAPEHPVEPRTVDL